MKRTQRRLRSPFFGYRVRYRYKKPKRAASPSADNVRQQKAEAVQQSIAAIATFDSENNPYLEFVDNLSNNLTNLPQEAFNKRIEAFTAANENNADNKQQQAEKEQPEQKHKEPEALTLPTSETKSPSSGLPDLHNIASSLLASDNQDKGE